MKCSESLIAATICRYSAASGECSTQARSQYSGWRRSAKPPSINAHSALTMNFVRALIDGGFADLRHPEYWDLAWVEHSPLAAEYRQMVAAISASLHVMETRSEERG